MVRTASKTRLALATRPRLAVLDRMRYIIRPAVATRERIIEAGRTVASDFLVAAI